MPTTLDEIPGHRPRTGDGENAWRAFAVRVQDRLSHERTARGEAERRAEAAEAAERRADAAERRLVALRERGDEFHELLQREEIALRRERRALVDLEDLLVSGDAAGALAMLHDRRRGLERLGVLP